MRIGWVARLAVSAVVLIVLLAFVPVGELWQAIRSVPAGVWGSVLVLFLAGHVIAAGKWWWLTLQQTPVPLGLSLRAHFAGLMANLCLPGIAGGDVVRAVWVMRRVEAREAVAIASLADRLLDTLALLLLACLGGLLSAEVGETARSALLLCGGLLIVCGLVIAGLYLRLRRRAPEGVLGRVVAALGVLQRRPGVLLTALASSLAIQGSFVGLNWWLGTAAGVQCPVAAWFLAWPLAKLVALAPISLAGLGVREAALVVFLTPFGGTAAEVAAAGLLWQGVLAAGGLIGSLALVPLRTEHPACRKEAAAA